ncbi:MAG: hypothetical protein AB1724_06770 [Thermodesulfobacteriota bacterium]
MKKWLVVCVLASLALVLTLPALAVDVDFSGEYRIRGFYNDNPTLQDDGEKDSASWLDHRFRLQAVLNANDKVSITTRADVFDDQTFGDEDLFFDGDGHADNDDIDVDAVYMTIMSPIGLFKGGRIPGGSAWGTDLGNTGVDYSFDRLEYFAATKEKDLVFGALYEKLVEDNTLGDVDDEGDCDSYYVLGVLKKDKVEAGMALRYQDVDEVADLVDNLPLIEVVDLYSAGTDISALAPMVGYPTGTYYMDLRQSVPATSPLGQTLGAANGLPPGTGVPVPATPLASGISGIYYSYENLQNYALAPYVKASFGVIGLEAEVIYEMGEYEAANRGITFLDANLQPVAFDDRDIDALTFKVEASADLEKAAFNLGYASAQGQDYGELLKTDGDITIGNLLYHGIGDDFRPLMILTGDAGGQPLNNGYTTMFSGVNLLYAGASFPLNDKLTLRGALGQAWTDEDDYSGGDDDLGFEVDLGLTWKIMDNLVYLADVGYLDEGDEILAGTALLPAAGNGDATFAVSNEIKVTF